MRGEGFEPPNDFRADLESASVGHLDTLAIFRVPFQKPHIIIYSN